MPSERLPIVFLPLRTFDPATALDNGGCTRSRPMTTRSAGRALKAPLTRARALMTTVRTNVVWAFRPRTSKSGGSRPSQVASW